MSFARDSWAELQRRVREADFPELGLLRLVVEGPERRTSVFDFTAPKNSERRVVADASVGCTITLSSADDLREWLSGALTAEAAVLRKRARIEGDLSAAMKFDRHVLRGPLPSE